MRTARREDKTKTKKHTSRRKLARSRRTEAVEEDEPQRLMMPTTTQETKKAPAKDATEAHLSGACSEGDDACKDVRRAVAQ
ncbi:hypothetical protein HPP92_018970 [Vanilla planifolia]|uniref:Uncharacterized protein n=1 Tax=Vanilla planifolia TaxID=51239 RepID=A0A835Q621_VANPL|nr:hypothetical protein HPP92_018970 [Vanilla planifolia]